MNVIDYEILRKRREQMLKRRTEEEQGKQFGFSYVHIVDGICYPVFASFPMEVDADSAEAKLRYLINGQKR